MMKKTFLALTFALAACGGGPMESPDNHGFGWEFDTVGPRGLKLRWFDGAPAEVAAGFEQVAARVLACMGVEAPLPQFVIITTADKIPSGRAGYYFPHPPLILLNNSNGTFAYWHEVVHYGLDYSAGESGIIFGCDVTKENCHTPQFLEIEQRCAA